MIESINDQRLEIAAQQTGRSANRQSFAVDGLRQSDKKSGAATSRGQQATCQRTAGPTDREHAPRGTALIIRSPATT
jgi:hypothetical protein